MSTIRALTLTDTVAFRELRLEALKQSPEAFLADYETRKQKPIEHFRSFIENPRTVILGVFKDSELVAMAALTRFERPKERHKGSLWNVYTKPECRAQGYSTKLLTELIATARSFGLKQLVLSVSEGNSSAQGIYQRLGFEVVGREPRAAFVGGRYFDSVLMYLDLALNE